MRLCILILTLSVAAQAHDIITTAITFDREILRIINDRCAYCHREGGKAFSMASYNEVRPWAVAIKEETLQRRMPPWGAVKGFGDFRNDQGLTQEQLDLIVSWVDGGVPEGEAKDLPKDPKIVDGFASGAVKGQILAGADFKLPHAFRLDGVMPKSLPERGTFPIVAEYPDGSVEPLVWLDDYKKDFGHPFLFRKPLDLPAGTFIRGVPPGGSLALLPVTEAP